METYFIMRFRYDKDHIYLNLYSYKIGANFELAFINCNNIKQHYKDIIEQLQHYCKFKYPVILTDLICMFEKRRKELSNEKS